MTAPVLATARVARRRPDRGSRRRPGCPRHGPDDEVCGIERRWAGGHGRAGGRAAGLQVGQRAVGAVESIPEEVVDGGHRLREVWRRGTGRLSAGVGFAVGYVLGARAGRQRFDKIIHRVSTVARRPEVQQARVEAAAAHTPLDARRPTGHTIGTAAASPIPASDADLAVGLPAEPGPAHEPPAISQPAGDHTGDPLR